MPIKKRPAPRPETADDGQVRGRFSRTRLWLVDMDDTIFNASAGMLEAIHRRMEAFIAQRLGISIEEAQRVQKDYWRQYGATFVGLERHSGNHDTPSSRLADSDPARMGNIRHLHLCRRSPGQYVRADSL